MKKEFCIMNKTNKWTNERHLGLHRHEVFFGGRNRHKSIEDGLVVYLTPELHNASDSGVHFNREFDLELKRAGQQIWMEHYNKTEEDFIKRYGRNYL